MIRTLSIALGGILPLALFIVFFTVTRRSSLDLLDHIVFRPCVVRAHDGSPEALSRIHRILFDAV